ncbi:BF3164 family lipoprotein [Bacteroides fragilis]|jgi:hypothetical protein|uniref:BF3164 family lipoprotein n=1 Tax=Bacteroides fragilis TaxID=817 RepID=UPI0015F687F7|nr:hypothetical protein [Bacteroides fragilis]MCE9399068.1 TolB-like 6-bladed beta-propeller domain-containing protein [Bacteroides fragilis]MCE9470639.1 TolB-like 6-bladed beta-propeller domain-containing protein [Bacteroides fragilis]
MRYCLGLILVLFTSCHLSSTRGLEFPSVDTLKLSSELFLSEELLKPEKMWIHDSLCLIRSSKDEYFFHLFNIAGTKICSFIGFGDAPAEMLSPVDFDVVNDTLQIYDSGKQKISFYALSDLSYGNVENICRQLSINVMASSVICTTDHSFYYLGETNRMYGFINSKIDTSYIDFPEDYRMLNSGLKHLLFQGHLRCSPNFDRLVYAASRFGYLQVLSPQENGSLSLVKDYFVQQPIFRDCSSQDMTAMSLSRENQSGFNDLSVTDELIFALYSGRRANEERSYFANQVWVFDWDGNPVKKMILPQDAWSIYVDQETNKLYTISYGEEKGEYRVHYNIYDLL